MQFILHFQRGAGSQSGLIQNGQGSGKIIDAVIHIFLQGLAGQRHLFRTLDHIKSQIQVGAAIGVLHAKPEFIIILVMIGAIQTIVKGGALILGTLVKVRIAANTYRLILSIGLKCSLIRRNRVRFQEWIQIGQEQDPFVKIDNVGIIHINNAIRLRVTTHIIFIQAKQLEKIFAIFRFFQRFGTVGILEF